MNPIIEEMARAQWFYINGRDYTPEQNGLWEALPDNVRHGRCLAMRAAIRAAMECEPTSQQYDAYLNGNTWHDWRALLGALLEDE